MIPIVRSSRRSKSAGHRHGRMAAHQLLRTFCMWKCYLLDLTYMYIFKYRVDCKHKMVIQYLKCACKYNSKSKDHFLEKTVEEVEVVQVSQFISSDHFCCSLQNFFDMWAAAWSNITNARAFAVRPNWTLRILSSYQGDKGVLQVNIALH